MKVRRSQRQLAFQWRADRKCEPSTISSFSAPPTSDWHLRIDAMLIEEIDAICAQTLQASVCHRLYVLRPAIGAAAPLAGIEVHVEGELGGKAWEQRFYATITSATRNCARI